MLNVVMLSVVVPLKMLLQVSFYNVLKDLENHSVASVVIRQVLKAQNDVRGKCY